MWQLVLASVKKTVLKHGAPHPTILIIRIVARRFLSPEFHKVGYL